MQDNYDDRPLKRYRFDDKIRIITTDVFDRAYEADACFRSLVNEAAAQVIKRQPSDVVNGITMWAKACKGALVTEGMSPPDATVGSEEVATVEDVDTEQANANDLIPAEEIVLGECNDEEFPGATQEETSPDGEALTDDDGLLEKGLYVKRSHEDELKEEPGACEPGETEERFKHKTKFQFIKLNAFEWNVVHTGLKMLESLPVSAVEYESGVCLYVHGISFYHVVHRLLNCILSHGGNCIGYHLIDFILFVMGLGHLHTRPEKLAAHGKRSFGTQGPSFLPTLSASERAARITAIVQCIAQYGRRSTKKGGKSGDVIPPAKVGGTSVENNMWRDPRTHAIPDWLLNNLYDMCHQFNGQPLIKLEQYWYCHMAMHFSFRHFRFASVHDLLDTLPGISVKLDKAGDSCVHMDPQVVSAAFRQRWSMNALPCGPPPMSLPAHPTQKSPSPVGIPAIPREVANKLREIVGAHNGDSIDTIYSIWRSGNNDMPIEYMTLGFNRFAELLISIPGINLVKEGHVSYAYCFADAKPLNVAVAPMAAIPFPNFPSAK